MSRRTLKYNRALEVDPEFPHNSSDQLYSHIQDQGYFWDSNIQRWIYSPSEQNDPASQLIKVRVWHDKNQVSQAAEKLIEVMGDLGYRCLEQSPIYPCRPPKANDARIYITFQPPY